MTTEPDEETYYGEPQPGPFVDENGMPVESAPRRPDPRPGDDDDAVEVPEKIDDAWIDRVTRGQQQRPPERDRPPPPQPPATPPPRPQD